MRIADSTLFAAIWSAGKLKDSSVTESQQKQKKSACTQPPNSLAVLRPVVRCTASRGRSAERTRRGGATTSGGHLQIAVVVRGAPSATSLAWAFLLHTYVHDEYVSDVCFDFGLKRQ